MLVGVVALILGLPDTLIGSTFDAAMAEVRRGQEWILIGLRHGGKVRICPPGDQELTAEHQLVFVALEPPAVPI